MELIQNEMKKLKDEIKLVVFTDYKLDDEGNKARRCLACKSVVNLLETLSSHADGRIKWEEYSIEADIETAEKYGVSRIPSILFLNEKDKEVIRYTAEPAGGEFVPFLKTLQIFSGKNTFYKDAILSNLKKMKKSDVKVFVTESCPYCPTVVPIANEFAALSKGKINVNIIDINANQDVALKYNIQSVPHTLINEKEHLLGMFTPQDLLDKLTKGQRDFGGMYA